MERPPRARTHVLARPRALARAAGRLPPIRRLIHQSRTAHERAWCGALLALLLIGLGMLAVHNLGHTGVWYDEAAQIWIAHGLHQYSAVQEQHGGWRAVVRNNRNANLDPGGYSLLLHLWTRIDHGLVWLRLSAFLFYLFTAALLVRYAWELTGSRAAALAAPFMLFAYGEVLYFAFEIRAYSMEIAGVVATGYILQRTVRSPSLGSHVALGLVCAIFLWSRYSFVVVTVAALGALASVRIWSLGRPRDELENLAGLLVPILNSGALIYRFTLWQHLRWGLGGGGANPRAVPAPDYVRAWVLRGQPLHTAAAIVWDNLASPPALPITIALVGLAAWPWARRWPLAARWPGARSFPAIATMALLVQLVSAALSARGSYPWSIGQKWSLYLHGVSILCALYLGSAAWCCARRWRRAPLLAAVVLMIAGLLTVRAATFRHLHWADLGPALARVNAMPVRPGSVFVPHYEIPALRYLYELGPFRGDEHYPEAFRFERQSEASAQAPIDAGQECLEYIVSPAPPDVLAPRFPGSRLTRLPGLTPACLVRIDPGAPWPARCGARPPATGQE